MEKLYHPYKDLNDYLHNCPDEEADRATKEVLEMVNNEIENGVWTDEYKIFFGLKKDRF